jgi:hypothetical protein
MALVRLAWDTHPDPNVNGFRLYVGRSPGIYTAPGRSQRRTSMTQDNAKNQWPMANMKAATTPESPPAPEPTPAAQATYAAINNRVDDVKRGNVEHEPGGHQPRTS